MTVPDVEWAQASSDWAKAMTVILPSVCTAVVALLIARSARSHAIGRDRRRRHQDNLEKISENFQAAHGTTNLLLSAYVQYSEVMLENPSDLAARGVQIESAKRVDAFMEAKKELSKLRGLLKLMRLNQAVTALDNYFEVISEVTEAVNFEDISPERLKSASNLFGKLEIEQDHVQSRLSTAFAET